MKIQYLLMAGSITCLIASCQNATSETPPSPQPPQQPAPKLKTASIPQLKVASDRLVIKKLPLLGTSYVQLDFRSRDAQAILNNTPRPTYPVTLAVLAGNPPQGTDVCNLPFSAVTKAIFEQCIKEGMNYFQVANTFGFAGNLTNEAGNTKTYTWKNDGSMVAITFMDDKLTSKTQTNLK